MHSVLYVRAMAAGTIKSHCMISKHVIAHLHMWLWCTLHPICLIVYRYIEIKSTFYFMTSTIQGRLMWQEKAFQSKKLYLFSKKMYKYSSDLDLTAKFDAKGKTNIFWSGMYLDFTWDMPPKSISWLPDNHSIFFLKFYVMKVGFISLQIIWVLPMVSSFVSSKFGQYSMCITNFPQRFW